jgi:RimJ/RimL family protein N-acetyltransferase
MARQIDVHEARTFFGHPSQQLGFTPDEIPEDEPIEFWASGPICGAFVYGLWPGVWQAHYGVKPEGWGHLIKPATDVLCSFWDARGAQRIIGWTEASNRPAIAFARRLGFVEDGRMPLPSGDVIMQGWTKWV